MSEKTERCESPEPVLRESPVPDRLFRRTGRCLRSRPNPRSLLRPRSQTADNNL